MIKIDYKLFDKYLLEINEYISYSEINKIKDNYSYLFDTKLKKILHFKYYIKYRNLEKILFKKNDELVNKLINECYILNNINGYELDKEQKTAVVTDDDNELLIAGAGSGKSLTLIGKIRYLIEYKNVKEEEILCISFTKDSMMSLKQNMQKNYNYNIDVYTFHKLALNILTYHNDNISICASDYLEYIIDEVLHSINKELSIYLKKNIVTFIRLFKSQGYNKDYFKIIYSKNNKNINKTKRKQNEIILKIIEDFYLIYDEELKSQGLYDFDDLIIYATKEVNEKGINKNYKYILIDEYQDTSLIRYRLINAIKKCCNSKIVAVGDDFQSIYRFTGCNLDIFTNFEKYFGFTKIIKIQNTYRNSNELIKVAGDFIMKNKRQINKDLKSNKKLDKPIKIYYYKNKNDFVKFLNFIYKKNKSNILVLSRNNFDINVFLNENLKQDNDNLIIENNKNIKIRYLTAHRSKGLEEDNVVIINLNDDKLGFPSKITNDEIINFVLDKEDPYPYSEERRLFYVALTRTKNNVYLFLKKGYESIFVKELINNSPSYIEIIDNVL